MGKFLISGKSRLVKYYSIRPDPGSQPTINKKMVKLSLSFWKMITKTPTKINGSTRSSQPDEKKMVETRLDFQGRWTGDIGPRKLQQHPDIPRQRQL